MKPTAFLTSLCGSAIGVLLALFVAPRLHLGPKPSPFIRLNDIRGQSWTFRADDVSRIVPDFGDPNYCRVQLEGGAQVQILREERDKVERGIGR